MSAVEIVGRVKYRHMANHRDIPLCSRLRPPVGERSSGDQVAIGRWVSQRAPLIDALACADRLPEGEISSPSS
jgi:hypothetical protein